MQTSGRTCREIAKLYPRHCERSEAIHLSPRRGLDCFAALAMAVEGGASGSANPPVVRSPDTPGTRPLEPV